MKRFKLSQLLEERIVLTVLDSLDGFQKNVMEYRVGFGIDHGMTHQEIGDLLGFSKQHISDTEEQALTSISKCCRDMRIRKIMPEYKTKIGELQLPTRAHNSLIRAGIIYVEQLLQYTMEDMRHLGGFGKRAIAYLRIALKERDLAMRVLPTGAPLLRK